jgi:hypothetical protein
MWRKSSSTRASPYPRVGFIVTNLARLAERVVAFYNQRGTAEQWIKEGKGAIKWTRLSCRSFAANAVRLQLHALAYNLGNFMRTLAMPAGAEPWSLTSLREKPIKIGAKVVSHGRYVMFQMAEVAGATADVPRHPAADRPTAGTAGTSMTGRWGQMRQTETAGVRLDERKTMGCNASVRSIGRFGRLRPHALRDSPCRGSPKERP